jgi:hypothetical protein
MKKPSLRLTVASAIIVSTLLASAGAMLTVGPWLFLSDPLPSRLDVIFTFAGDNQRLHYSRNLMERYSAAHWVLSDFHHYYSRILVRNGFAMVRVTAVDTAANTLSEVNALADWLMSAKVPVDGNIGSARDLPDTVAIGLVSSPYHMRRIRFMTRDVFRDRGVVARFYYLPVPFEKHSWTRKDLRKWWKSKTLRGHVLSEIGKLLVYWLFG